MSITPLDSGIFADLLADEAAAGLLSDRAEIAAMLRFEAALAEAQAETGVIPEEAAVEIAALESGSGVLCALGCYVPGCSGHRTGLAPEGFAGALRKPLGYFGRPTR
jgi:3-carboxy-cis,cis-muconate cycloisomerase